MAKPPTIAAEEKVRIVLSVLAGEVTIAEAARRAKVSEQSVGNWKRQFLEGGRTGIETGRSKPSGPFSDTADARRDLAVEALSGLYVDLRCCAAVLLVAHLSQVRHLTGGVRAPDLCFARCSCHGAAARSSRGCAPSPMRGLRLGDVASRRGGATD
ncbi:hypothetical protein DEO23_00225 [Brachybacterium endophyticum]|uniref:Insertion element IS150 protein InsJ-like helix-turn-helix domain-containing protein n=1 Tax=Brachybacterium endophyticum TaxID=2182385 RepID=A0A2U2RMS2_9MICO|nr:helix-turn-helix domain-containing protein [Brachybacterium endophyticum]PWH07131.1 hypothetical protein DEO23_00225 [Brachybacterium endophyticum]